MVEDAGSRVYYSPVQLDSLLFACSPRLCVCLCVYYAPEASSREVLVHGCCAVALLRATRRALTVAVYGVSWRSWVLVG